MSDDAPTPAPKRRRFRFSLRTLFVVMTIIAIGLAYQLNWIRQRHNALSGGRFRGLRVHPSGASPLLPKTVSAPGWLWLFGEPGYVGISMSISERYPQDLTPVEHAEHKRVCQLFPETVQNYLEMLPPDEWRKLGPLPNAPAQ